MLRKNGKEVSDIPPTGDGAQSVLTGKIMCETQRCRTWSVGPLIFSRLLVFIELKNLRNIIVIRHFVNFVKAEISA